MNLTLLSQLCHQRKRKNKAAKGKTHNLKIWISSCYVTFTLPLSHVQPRAGEKNKREVNCFLKSEETRTLEKPLQTFLVSRIWVVFVVTFVCVAGNSSHPPAFGVHMCLLWIDTYCIENGMCWRHFSTLMSQSTLNSACFNYSSMLSAHLILHSSSCCF